MPLTFHSTLHLDGTVSRLMDDLPAVKSRVLTRIGGMLLGRQKSHFEQLSRTGSSNGVTWTRQSAATFKRRQRLQRQGRLAAGTSPEHQGVETGRTRAGFRFMVKGNSVRLGAGRWTAEGVLMAGGRPVFPKTIPSGWIDSANQIAEREVSKL